MPTSADGATDANGSFDIAEVKAGAWEKIDSPWMRWHGWPAPGTFVFQVKSRFVVQLVIPAFGSGKTTDFVNPGLCFLRKGPWTNDTEIELKVLQHSDIGAKGRA